MRPPDARCRAGVALGLALALLGGPASAEAPLPAADPDQDPAPARGAEGAAPPAAGAEVTEDELRALEAALGAEAAEAPPAPPAPAAPGGGWLAGALQSMNPDISLILDAAAAVFSVEDPLQLGGHDPSRTGFNLQQLELYLASNVGPFFRMEANIVFGQFGVEVEEAYGTTLALPGNLQVRAGQLLTRLGRQNATHPHAWSFADRPLVLGKMLGSEGSRGLGVELSWLTPLPWYAEVVASMTDAGGECCARSFYGGDDPGVNGLEDFVYTLALKQFFPLGTDWSLAWGLSAQLGPNATGHGNRTEIYATDLYLRFKPLRSSRREALSLTVETLFRTRQVPGDVLQDWGGFAELVWNIVPEWEVGARYEGVSGVADDPLDPAWTGSRQRANVQGTFYPSHFSRLRLQLGRDAPAWRDRVTWSAFLALELVIGAHGAHDY